MTVTLHYMDEDDNLTQYSQISVPFENGAATVDLAKLFKSHYWILTVRCTTENYGNCTEIHNYMSNEIIGDDNGGYVDDYDGGPDNQIDPTPHSANGILKSTNGQNNANIKSYLKTGLDILSNEADTDTPNNTTKKSDNTTLPSNDDSKVIDEAGVEENQNMPIIVAGLLICLAFALLLARKFKS